MAVILVNVLLVPMEGSPRRDVTGSYTPPIELPVANFTFEKIGD